MNKHKTKFIPLALTNEEEYKDLTDEEKRALELRLMGLRDIGLELRDGNRCAVSHEIVNYLEDIELDLSVRLDLYTMNNGGESIWQIHNSWTLLTTPAEMRNALPKSFLRIVDSPAIDSTVEIESILKWFEAAGGDLVVLIDHLQNAKSIPEALASHIAIDAVVVKMLLSCYKLRLSPKLSPINPS